VRVDLLDRRDVDLLGLLFFDGFALPAFGHVAILLREAARRHIAYNRSSG
jgi:hypothetical protein